MNCELKRFLLLLLSLLLLCSVSLAAGTEETWICLKCGQESTGNACAVCNEPRGVWVCVECGTRNLSGTCRKCGKEKAASLALQAEDSRMLFAFPAVRSLAAAGDAVNMTRLGRYYEKGIGVQQDAEKTVSILRAAGETGYAPAWVYLGRLYDAGIVVGSIANGANHREGDAKLEADLSHSGTFHFHTKHIGKKTQNLLTLLGIGGHTLILKGEDGVDNC